MKLWTALVVVTVFSATLVGPMLVGAQETTDSTTRPAGIAPVYVVPIYGEIDASLAVFVRRSATAAQAAGASHIVFDIDTFGGRVDSALQITTTIGSLVEIETIAFVRIRPDGSGVSWSAGALIAFATDEIYMAGGTSMGSAAPVLLSADGGISAADEKTVSALRTQMAALAEKNGYPVGIARAMVDLDIELIEVTLDGVVGVVTADEREAFERRAAEQGRTLEFGRIISPAGKLLSLTAGEMERYGVSSGTIDTVDELIAELGVTDRPMVMVEPTAADRLVAVVTGGGVTSILILIGLVAIFMELSSPGFGVPGAVGILAFALVFAANGLLGYVGSVELLLFLLGLTLLIVEIFLIPGFGVTGIGGILLMVLSLVLSMQGFVVPQLDWEWQAFHRNLLLVLGNLLGALVLFGLSARFVPRSRAFGRLVLATTEAADEGFTMQQSAQSEALVGRAGVATTPLRPAGKARIEGRVVSVESDGEFIEADSAVEVVALNGNRVVVRRVL